MSIILSNILYPPDSWGYNRAGEIQGRERGPGMGRRRKIKKEEGEKRAIVLFFSVFVFYCVQR